MLFAFRYRSYFRLSEAQFESESDDAKWLARTIWALEAERDNLRSISGNTPQN